ncbi:AfsR/SARP family transcriptional regulator [Actinoplanes sp. G11-F43]|uniref:AfsR/SARP family transcriptional regulator n=1 Tax=Actinoplanes sp. G11-F43 TaxID=3424130 RepID=UPI003D346DFD
MAEHVRVEYRVLGPLEVVVGGRHLDLGGARQRIVLACLALEAGRTVPVHRLVAAIYGAEPPASARAQVQICVSALRRLLPDGRLVTRNQGYPLDTTDVDLLDHERLVEAARAAGGGAGTVPDRPPRPDRRARPGTRRIAAADGRNGRP